MAKFRYIEERQKPKCYDRLHELSEEEWHALEVLGWRERPPSIEGGVRDLLRQRDLIRGNSLTEEGRLVLAWREDFTREWDYAEDGKVYKSCAVVASDGKGNDVLLHAYGPSIDWHLEQIGNECEDLGLAAPEPGVWVWVGSMGSVRVSSVEYGEDWDFEATGDWREPTAEEWEHIKDEECPWTKENLPKWTN